MSNQTEISKAIDVLIAALNEDKSEGSYYYSWQANIAMAFKYEYDSKIKMVHNMHESLIHDIANQAAKNFLDMLCRKSNDMDDVIKVAERLYREANPDTKMDTPSFIYEQVEKAKKRKVEAGSNLSLYDWCEMEIKKSGNQSTPTTNE